MDDRRALRLDADADAGAGEPRGAQAEERGVGGVVHAHDARNAAARLDPLDEALQKLGERNAAERAEELDAEGRRDADHHLASARSRPSPAPSP